MSNDFWNKKRPVSLSENFGKKAKVGSKSDKKFGSAKLFIGLLLLSPFIYIDKILDPVLVPRILYFAALLIPFFVYFIFSIKKKKTSLSILTNNLVWIYLAYILLTAISVIVSLNPGEGIWVWLKDSLFFLLFVAGAILLSDFDGLDTLLPKFFIPFALLVLSVGAYQIIEILQTGVLDHQSSYSVVSVFAHRNLFAQIMFFILPFLMMGVYSLRGVWRWFSAILIGFSLVMITLTLVKSVWLAVITSSVFSFVLLIIFKKSLKISFPTFKKVLVFAFVGVLVVLVSIAVYSRYNTIETFEKQTYVLNDYKFGSAIERVFLWEKSLEMFKESPIIGVGAGNWRIFLTHYGTQGMRSAEGEILYQRPHNDFLWILAENGIFSFVFYVLIFLIAFYYLFVIIKKSPDISDKYFALFLFFFMVGYLIIASLSFPHERPVHSMLLNLVLVFILVKYQKLAAPKSEIVTSRMIPFLMVAIVVLGSTVYVGVKRFQSEMFTKAALGYRADNNWQQVIDNIDKSYSFFSKLDPTGTPLKWYSGLAWYNLGKMDNAFADFQDAFKSNPYHMHVLNNLATIYGINGDYEKAEKYYKEAIKISSEFADAELNLCVILYKSQQLDSAYQLLRTVKNGDVNPNYKNVVTTFVYEKVENLKKKVDDKDLYLTLTRIRNNKEWMVKVHEQSIYDDVPLDEHLFIESIYVLATVDQSIDSARAAYLRNKYLKK